MMNKAVKITLGLMLVGSAVFAQSLADAQKAIDAEQYQKGKAINLITLHSNYYFIECIGNINIFISYFF